MEPEPAIPPSREVVEARVRDLCRAADLREPDRVEHFVDGDYVALWDDEKVAVVIEMEREGL